MTNSIVTTTQSRWMPLVLATLLFALLVVSRKRDDADASSPKQRPMERQLQDQPSQALHGTIFEWQSGDPVANVRVELVPYVGTACSDVSGRYRIDFFLPVESQTFDVVAYKEGYELYYGTVIFGIGRDRQWDTAMHRTSENNPDRVRGFELMTDPGTCASENRDGFLVPLIFGQIVNGHENTKAVYNARVVAKHDELVHGSGISDWKGAYKIVLPDSLTHNDLLEIDISSEGWGLDPYYSVPAVHPLMDGTRRMDLFALPRRAPPQIIQVLNKFRLRCPDSEDPVNEWVSPYYTTDATDSYENGELFRIAVLIELSGKIIHAHCSAGSGRERYLDSVERVWVLDPTQATDGPLPIPDPGPNKVPMPEAVGKYYPEKEPGGNVDEDIDEKDPYGEKDSKKEPPRPDPQEKLEPVKKRIPKPEP